MQNVRQKQKTAEADVLRACCDLLTAERIWWRRWNTGAVKNGKRFFRFGKPGDADILAVPQFKCDCGANGNICPRRWSVPLWIECKADKGRQTGEQRDFEIEVTTLGQHYLLVRDVDTLRNWLKERGIIG